MILLDFETQSPADLGSVGSWNYSRHPQTRVVCLAWWDPVRQGFELWYPRERYPDVTCPWSPLEDLYRLVDEGYELHAWNSSFERNIWDNIMVPRYGAPALPLERWHCTMAKSASAGYPLGLAAAAKALDLPEEKDGAGHAVMMQVARPRRLKNTPGVHFHEDRERIEKVLRYCLQDVRVELEAHHALPKLSKRERDVWLRNERINRWGVRLDRRLAQNAVRVWDHLHETLTAELIEATGGEITSPGQVARIKKFSARHGVEIGSVRDEVVSRALAHPGLPEPVRRVLYIRQTLAGSTVKKYAAALNLADAEDRFRGAFQFRGTHTGRFAGRDLQLQNLNADRSGWSRGMNFDTLVGAVRSCDLDTLQVLYGEPEQAIGVAVRGMVIPSDGYDLLGMDFSQVQVRIVFWVAGELDALDGFGKGTAHPYRVMAARLFGGSPEDVVKPSPAYNFGKAAVLGFGFGMGAQRFLATAPDGTTPEEAERAKRTYRETFSKVPELWDALESGARKAITGQATRIGPLLWTRDKFSPYVELPSGRRLRYPELRLVEEETERGPSTSLEFRAGYRIARTWGGTLTADVAQAIEVDLLTDAMARLMDAGYRPVLHAHDELVVEIERGEDEARAVELFKTVPRWAEGLPIDGEAWRARCYRK